MDYLNTCRRLCDGLGVGDIINADLIARADNNRDIRDSLVNIVTETFYALNGRFRENGMEEVSGLMAAGGWIEGVYLGTRNIGESTADLQLRIAEQKMTLDNLMGLLDSYPASEALDRMKGALEPVEAAFAGVKITENAAAATAAEDGTVVISGGPEVEFDDATLTAISVCRSHRRRVSVRHELRFQFQRTTFSGRSMGGTLKSRDTRNPCDETVPLPQQ